MNALWKTVQAGTFIAAIIGAYYFFEQQKRSEAAPIAEFLADSFQPAVDSVAFYALEARAEMDTLRELLKQTIGTNADAPAAQAIMHVHERILDTIVATQDEQRRWHAEARERQIRLLCWTSANCDAECPYRRTRCRQP